MPKKIKREFVPDELKEVYVDFYWSQERLWNLQIPTCEFEMSKLEWILDYPVWYMDPHPIPRKILDDPTLDPAHRKRMMEADLSFPIYVLEWRGRFLTLDGIHRLLKNHISGSSFISAKLLNETQISEILPSDEDFTKGFLANFKK